MTNRRYRRAPCFALLFLIAAAGGWIPASVRAAEHQIWLISTRNAPLSGDLDAGQKDICYQQLAEDGQWRPSDEMAFRDADDSALPTTVVVHGDRMDADDAVEFAEPIFRGFLACHPSEPSRVVIWSWPSDRIFRRVRPDVQTKMDYCGVQSYYLAAWMKKVKSDVPLGLVGYSLGGRIILGSLQLYSGKQVDCRTLAGRETDGATAKRTAPIRAILIAPAADAGSLAPDGDFDAALSQVETMLVAYNPCDPVLRWYPRIYGRRGPQALGRIGPEGVCGGNLETLDLAGEVGRSHKWDRYIASCILLNSLDRVFFFDK